MRRIEPIAVTAERFLHPHERLAPFVFDDNDVMHENIRNKLLEISNFVIENTVNKFEGLEVEDICLIGSLSEYLYSEGSDFDIVIKVKNKADSFFNADEKTLIKILNFIYAGFSENRLSFMVEGRLVDISLKHKIENYYSILHNKWVKNDKLAPTQNIDLNFMMYNYYDLLEKYAEFMLGFETRNGKYSLEDCNKLLEYYIGIVIYKNLSTYQDRLIFKLLTAHGKIGEIGQHVSESFVNSLSLYKV